MFTDSPLNPTYKGPAPSGAFWTPNRLELLTWLIRKALPLSELYQGAVRIMFEEPPFPGRDRFVTHAMREITNRLPDYIAGAQTAGRLEYVNRMDQLVLMWRESGFSLDGSFTASDSGVEGSIPPSPDITISRILFLEISNLIKDHELTRSRPLDRAQRLFEAIAPENKRLGNTLRPIILQWVSIAKWSVGRVHDAGSSASLSPRDLETQFELFETTLAALVRGFFRTIEELDEILEDTNS